jgi:hypothetical protein
MNAETNPTIANDRGFTLVEILVAIVVAGILAAVAIIGIASLTDSGGDSACEASRDAAKTAATVHYANTGSWPTTFTAMTSTTPKELEVPSGVTVNSTTLVGSGWTLTLTPGSGSVGPTFACS